MEHKCKCDASNKVKLARSLNGTIICVEDLFKIDFFGGLKGDDFYVVYLADGSRYEFISMKLSLTHVLTFIIGLVNDLVSPDDDQRLHFLHEISRDLMKLRIAIAVKHNLSN